MSVRTADAAVVGAGVAGLAAASALVDAGLDVRCFERAEPGSGQSAGLVRVFRHVHDRLELVELVRDARAEWDAWSERAGVPLVGDEGVLYASADAAEAAALLARAGVPHRMVDEAEQRELLPVLAPPGGPALFDERGGVIRVRPTIDFLAGRLGERVVREEVLAVQPGSEGVRLFTPEGIWHCERALLCAGAATAELARPLGIEIPVETPLHVRLTFALRDARAGTLACWLDRTGRYGATVYSGPVPGSAAFAVGLATADQLEEDPSLGRLRRYVEAALPGLEPEPVASRPCRLTVLPWHADAFAAWRAGPVVAFAGHNLFKLAPTLGRLLAQAVVDDRLPAALTPPD